MLTPDSTVTSPLSVADQVKARIQQLQQALQQQLPNYESLLHTIHRSLANDPDTVQILTEDEIGVICAGLAKRTGVFIAVEAVKKIGKKNGGKLSVDDL